MAKKRCPQCAELIKAEARLCRFCGHQITAEEELRDIKEMSSKRTSTPWTSIIIILAIISSIVMFGSSDHRSLDQLGSDLHNSLKTSNLDNDLSFSGQNNISYSSYWGFVNDFSITNNGKSSVVLYYAAMNKRDDCLLYPMIERDGRSVVSLVKKRSPGVGIGGNVIFYTGKYSKEVTLNVGEGLHIVVPSDCGNLIYLDIHTNKGDFELKWV